MIDQDLFDYAGCIHVHSSYSFDGRTPIHDMMKAARSCGLDFIMLTDHGGLYARKHGHEGWHDGTLLIVGQEISPRFNHYLAFQIQEAVQVQEDDPNADPQGYIDFVRNRGGLGFIAHPDHEGSHLFHVKHYPWLHWPVNGFNGMGIWDFMTDWQMSLRGYAKALYSYVFPTLVLQGPRAVTLARWDDLNRERKIVGIAELDNHNTIRKILGLALPVFPFSRAFRTIRTHILTNRSLTGEKDRDIQSIFSALRQGRVYISLDSLRPAKGFSFFIEDGSHRAYSGDDLHLQEKALLRIALPDKARIHIIKDGNLWQTSMLEDTAEFQLAERGIYRVEAWLRVMGKHHPWIFSNPIFVH
jgi:hypothetical protein